MATTNDLSSVILYSTITAMTILFCGPDLSLSLAIDPTLQELKAQIDRQQLMQVTQNSLLHQEMAEIRAEMSGLTSKMAAIQQQFIALNATIYPAARGDSANAGVIGAPQNVETQILNISKALDEQARNQSQVNTHIQMRLDFHDLQLNTIMQKVINIENSLHNSNMVNGSPTLMPTVVPTSASLTQLSAMIADLEKQVNDMKNAQSVEDSAQNDRLDQLETDKSTLESQVDKNTQDINVLQQGTGGGSSQQLSAIQESLKDVNSSLAGELSALASRVSSVEGNVHSLQQSVAAHATQLHGLDTDVSSVEAQMSGNTMKLNGMSTSLNRLSSRVDVVSGIVQNHEAAITLLNHTLTNLQICPTVMPSTSGPQSVQTDSRIMATSPFLQSQSMTTPLASISAAPSAMPTSRPVGVLSASTYNVPLTTTITTSSLGTTAFSPVSTNSLPVSTSNTGPSTPSTTLIAQVNSRTTAIPMPTPKPSSSSSMAQAELHLNSQTTAIPMPTPKPSSSLSTTQAALHLNSQTTAIPMPTPKPSSSLSTTQAALSTNFPTPRDQSHPLNGPTSTNIPMPTPKPSSSQTTTQTAQPFAFPTPRDQTNQLNGQTSTSIPMPTPKPSSSQTTQTSQTFAFPTPRGQSTQLNSQTTTHIPMPTPRPSSSQTTTPTVLPVGFPTPGGQSPQLNGQAPTNIPFPTPKPSGSPATTPFAFPTPGGHSPQLNGQAPTSIPMPTPRPHNSQTTQTAQEPFPTPSPRGR